MHYWKNNTSQNDKMNPKVKGWHHASMSLFSFWQMMKGHGDRDLHMHMFCNKWWSIWHKKSNFHVCKVGIWEKNFCEQCFHQNCMLMMTFVSVATSTWKERLSFCDGALLNPGKSCSCGELSPCTSFHTKTMEIHTHDLILLDFKKDHFHSLLLSRHTMNLWQDTGFLAAMNHFRDVSIKKKAIISVCGKCQMKSKQSFQSEHLRQRGLSGSVHWWEENTKRNTVFLWWSCKDSTTCAQSRQWGSDHRVFHSWLGSAGGWNNNVSMMDECVC